MNNINIASGLGSQWWFGGGRDDVIGYVID